MGRHEPSAEGPAYRLVVSAWQVAVLHLAAAGLIGVLAGLALAVFFGPNDVEDSASFAPTLVLFGAVVAVILAALSAPFVVVALVLIGRRLFDGQVVDRSVSWFRLAAVGVVVPVAALTVHLAFRPAELWLTSTVSVLAVPLAWFLAPFALRREAIELPSPPT